MDMKNTKRNLMFAVCLSFAACTSNYLTLNSDPYGITDDEMQRDGYAVKSALVGMANAVISPDVNTTQFTEVLLGCSLCGYMAPAKDGWNNVTIANYNPTDDWTNVLMASDRIIPVVYTNYKTLKQVTDDPVILAVGEVIKVAAMHRVTDTYGPVPYSKIGQNGEINVPYDSQEEVYRTMFSELDAALEVLLENRTNNFSASADVIYGGNVEKWIRFANSLKLRLAMRISYADPELSKEMAESAVNGEVGVMTSNDDNAMFSAWGTKGNTIRAAVMYNIATHDDHTACTTQSGDSHAAAEIICYMNGYNDPRRTKFFTETEWTGGAEYIGMRHGIEIPNHAETGHKYSGIYFGSESEPACWMNASEVAFLQAEAVAVFGYSMPKSAKEYYKEGIRLSFEQYGVSGYEDYIMDATSVPTVYSDPAGSNSYGSISSITVAWDDKADREVMQERIITQKWIANWLLGLESWADWRRTGYPRLIPASDAGNKSAGKVNSVQGARRMPYPASERSNNAQNYQDAVSTLLGGADEMATRLWFDCKQNNPCYN